jgi:phage terminase large subunit GpA-like protein
MINLPAPPLIRPELDEFRFFVRAAAPPRRRTMRRFAEEEIVLPTGPYEGRRFTVNRQPYARLLLDAYDSGDWTTFAIVGPSQSGKTLTGSVIPLLYHLFEHRETVIYGVPDLNMANDKWKQDILPVIERTRYRDLLPSSGGGSRGGRPTSVEFKNGATLRFMTGGGGDKSVAGFTSRVLVVTEVDGFDTIGGGSRESKRIKQLEARTRAFERRRRIYKECTVSTETGHIWTEYQAGSASKLALPCPHCHTFVTPEREHFNGWEGAADVFAAGEMGAIHCPACGEAWNEKQRIEANHAAVLLHKGQTIGTDGSVAGPLPRTETLGFRWTAANNLLWSQASLAKEEWEKSREVDQEAAELEMRQFVWTLPSVPATVEMTTLTSFGLTTRQDSQQRYPRGLVPAEAQAFTIGLDIGKRVAHWVAIAWFQDGSGVVVDYGELEIPTDSMGLESAILYALRAFRARCEMGWAWENHADKRPPDQVWIDSGYQGSSEYYRPVYMFVKESGPLDENRYQACKGFGETDGRQVRYQAPSKINKEIVLIGEEYHFTYDASQQVYRVDINADHWKSFLHARLAVPLAAPYNAGTLVLFNDLPKNHDKFIKHLLAESQTQEWHEKKSRYVWVWKRKSKQNHKLDAAYMACAAGHFCGVRLIESDPLPPPPPAEKSIPFKTADGRNFFVLEREA